MEALKYHGCGNDFIIIKQQKHVDYRKLAIKLCHRKTGVGADGLIVVIQKPLTMLIFNSDGTEALMCGNGLRCFALFCYEKGIIKESAFDVITKGGIMKVNITSFDPFYVSINLGKAFFDHELLSINSFIRPFIKQTLNILNQSYEIHTLFLGIIHTVIFVSNLEKIIKTKVGSLICSHELFPMKTNVNFVQIIDRKSFYIKTFERGAGWTESCGTGAASSFFIANYLGLCDEDAKAILPFCTLKIARLPDDSITLRPSC